MAMKLSSALSHNIGKRMKPALSRLLLFHPIRCGQLHSRTRRVLLKRRPDGGKGRDARFAAAEVATPLTISFPPPI